MKFNCGDEIKKNQKNKNNVLTLLVNDYDFKIKALAGIFSECEKFRSILLSLKQK